MSHPDGEFTVDTETWQGTKDRSWGIRRVGERIGLGAPQPFGSAFFLWAPNQWEDHITHAVFFDGAKGEALVREGLTSPLYPAEGDIPDQLDDVATHMATAVHRIDYHPGTPWARSAELDLIDLYGEVRTITMEPQLRFQFKGLGYIHPRWSQGCWQGELEIAGESFDPLALDPLAPENLHVQQVVKVSDGVRTGIGALEQIVVGPYEPAGFTEMFDGAR